MNLLYDRIYWHNDTTPALNESNLNSMSKGIADIDARVVELAGAILETIPQLEDDIAEVQEIEERLNELSMHPPYIGENGNWYIWDTTTREYVDSGVDASITVTVEDVTMLPYGSTPYVTNTGTNTDPVFHFFIPQAKSAYQVAVDAGFIGSESQFNDQLGHFADYANTASLGAQSAQQSAQSANQSALNAANSATDAQGYAEDAEDIKTEISTMVGAVEFSVDFTTGELIYTNNATYRFFINQTTGNLEWEVVA